MHTALAATSQVIVDFLRQCLETDADLGPLFNQATGGTMVVTLSDPRQLVMQQLEGLSVWLYHLASDEERRNAGPPRGGPRETTPPALWLRLHYLVTPIVLPATRNGPALVQTILGKVLQALHEHPRFTVAGLQGDPAEARQEFSARLEAMALEDLAKVWSALAQSYHVSVSYEVRSVEIASERA